MVIKNKRGWIRILEAFFAIILIMGILLVVVNRNFPINENSEKIYQEGNSILQEIELNKSLRQSILGATPPIEWINFVSENLTDVRTFILNQTPNYLNCSAKICEIGDECISNQNISVNIYTNSIGIYANKDVYSPRQLKLFCWEK